MKTLREYETAAPCSRSRRAAAARSKGARSVNSTSSYAASAVSPSASEHSAKYFSSDAVMATPQRLRDHWPLSASPHSRGDREYSAGRGIRACAFACPARESGGDLADSRYRAEAAAGAKSEP